MCYYDLAMTNGVHALLASCVHICTHMYTHDRVPESGRTICVQQHRSEYSHETLIQGQ